MIAATNEMDQSIPWSVFTKTLDICGVSAQVSAQVAQLLKGRG